ncbi:MAG: hypothetical protein J4F44_00865 [Acidimicrobiia bacterium]|nr:hypothetical protein [Acidimicrobiia bacterium]
MSDDDNLLDLDIEEEEVDETFDPEFEEGIEEDDDDPLADDDDELEEDDEEKVPERNAKRPPQAAEGDLDEVDPDNLEADLNTILRDRIAAADDVVDDEEAGEVETGQPAELLGSVTPRRDDEWLCEGCFLLVSKSQLGSRTEPRCPSGEEICPSLDRLGP